MVNNMNTFMYFAYGSNMLAQRIHIQNPTAVRIGTGKLNAFRLDFNTFSRFWDGCPSTVVPDPEEHVWGVLWRLNTSDLSSLDRQEGVDKKLYVPFEVNIVTPNGDNILSRCYMLVNQPVKQIPLPLERRPSKAYLETILLGANESGLPFDYLQYLSKILDNGNDGPTMPWSKREPLKTTEL
ncbi:PREDICTED: gamma-glutamylcyclotransferase-like isoform X2 [Diuraphis noxia]|uniref:gamma-glutamylcyclotransferase-like isoform X2 n=1 Tax=Diuraphis noxia TaxID=143948 RepID=UPI000763B819|nr:PREDICTED: gamma-glutamylcyclotransferase-like isoform X2 [Diuraphis noxia]